MVRIYILPCAGYDRPGGEVTRAVVEKLAEIHEDIVIGSVGALFRERPGEIRDYRGSGIICLDGCGTNCASELARARGREDISVISIPEATESGDDFEDKVQQIIRLVEEEMKKREPKASSTVTSSEPSSIEFLEEKIDKFTLRVAKGFKYSDNDFWVRIEGDQVRIGASDLLQQMISDVYFVELAEPGTHVEMFDDVGAMESTKIMAEIIVPVSGTIVDTNKMLEDSPELINESPYERGWIYVIEPDDIQELDLLSNDSEYMKNALEKAEHEIGKKVT